MKTFQYCDKCQNKFQCSLKEVITYYHIDYRTGEEGYRSIIYCPVCNHAIEYNEEAPECDTQE